VFDRLKRWWRGEPVFYWIMYVRPNGTYDVEHRRWWKAPLSIERGGRTYVIDCVSGSISRAPLYVYVDKFTTTGKESDSSYLREP
jgi:hypothetical protein